MDPSKDRQNYRCSGAQAIRFRLTSGRIAGNIERLRQEKGWTQAAAAERMDGDLRWYQRFESGKHVLSLDTLIRLAHVFRVDVSEFFKADA